eukprot:jgi/Tetstr1/453674/TSEL_040630.t1
MQTAPSAAFSGFWPQRKEEVDDFLREHGQTAPAEARHTMAINADLNNAEAARVEAEVRAQVLEDDSAFRGVHAGAKERLHNNTSPSDAKGSNLVVIDVSDAIHDASGSREVFNEDGTMVRKKCREVDCDDWQFNPRQFASLTAKWGACTIDRFATFDNALLPRYNACWRDPRCEAVDALRLSDAAWRCEL